MTPTVLCHFGPPSQPFSHLLAYQTRIIEVKGITVDNAQLSGTVSVTGSDLAADVKFSVFELGTSGGTATGAVNVSLGLQNPADASKPIDISEMLVDLGNVSSYLKPGFVVSGSFDLRLNNLVLTPDLDLTGTGDSIFPAGAYIQVFIPDIKDLEYNPNAYDVTDTDTDNDSGVFVTYPQLGPLGNFNCLTFASIVSTFDLLLDDLESVKGFSFLSYDLPLINLSLGELVDFAGDLSRFFAALATGDQDTINTLEADLKSFLGLPVNSPLIDLSVQDATPAPTAGGSTGVSATHFNPHGNNNALTITARNNGQAWDDYLVDLVDDGLFAPGLDVAEVVYDKPNKRISARFNSTATKAKTLKQAFENAIGADWLVTYDTTTSTGDGPANTNGEGVITTVALKFSFQYSVAYGNSQSLQFNVDDLLASLPDSQAAIVQELIAGVGAFVDLEGTANLNVTANADLRIDFGIDVSNPCGWLPFLYDTTGITLSAAIRGTDLTFTASVGGLGIFVNNGTATMDWDGNPDTIGAGEDATLALSLSVGDDRRHYFRDGFAALASGLNLTFDGALSLDLPLYFPTNSLPLGGSDQDDDQDGNPDNIFHLEIGCLDDYLLAIANGTRVTTSECPIVVRVPDINNLFGQFNPCDLITNAPLLLDGLDVLLGVIQDGLDSEVLNRDLPLVGKKLSQAANVIGDFRGGLLAELRLKLAEAGDPIGLVKEAIWSVLGRPGLNLLTDADGAKLTAADQIDIECTGDAIEFDLHLAKSIELVDTTANPIGFDIGIPGFGLEVNANVVVEVGFSFHLRFAISASDGFYFITNNPEDELQIEFKVSVPALSASGELFFLQLTVADESDGKDLTGKDRESTMFTGTFSVDIRDSVGSGGKLTLGDMLVSPGQILDADLTANADLHLDVIVSFEGSTVFPRIVTEFDLVWTWTVGGPIEGELDFGFHNVSLDLGSFISKFIQPILGKIKIVTDPLDPLIDVLTAPLPVLSELAGRDYTMLDLAERFGLLKPGTREFIEAMLLIANLANDSSVSDDGSILIPLGGFNLTRTANGQVGRDPFDVDLSDVDLSDATTDVNGKAFIGAVEEGGFTFPFLKISELVKLFLGQPVSMFEYHAPKLEFSASFEGQVPIFPPLYVIFGGSVGATIDLAFGYDTLGLQKYFSSTTKNAADLLDGFYVKDREDNGEEITELTLSGGLTAGAELNVLVAEAGVQGGIFADIGFDLRDPNEDGRVRLSELMASIQSGPLCLFDVHGRIYAALEAFFEIHTFVFGDIEKTWRFAEITLLEFDITCPTPILASVTDSTGELLLHVGENASRREHGDTADGNEQFLVRHLSGTPESWDGNPNTTTDGETVEVSFGGITQSYSQVKTIKGLAGKGNDTIDLRGVYASADIRGGDGDDLLEAGRGTGSAFYGDAGDDVITAETAENDFEGVADTFYGGTGSDILTGLEQDDQLFGEDGEDTLSGGEGNDFLDGGDDNDVVAGELGDDTILGGDGADLLEGHDGLDKIIGDNGSVDPASGNVSAAGGSGDDTLIGGPGDDKLAGGEGDDTIEGGSGNDVILGDEGTIAGLLEVLGLAGSGNDVLAGGGGADTLFGTGGDDSLFGGAYLESSATEVVDADGADFLDGGDGNDTVFADDAHSSQSTTFAGGTIGDLVWFDADVDGLQDEGENGLAGVTVRLYSTDGSTSTLMATTTTNSLGAYQFTGLAEGEYYLIFTAPVDHSFSPVDQGDDDDLDSDADATGKTATLQLGPGQRDSTWDAGLSSGQLRISINDVTLIEGDAGTTSAIFTVTLNAPRTQVVTVCYRTQPGVGSTGAQRVLDYSTVDYTLVFAPGVTSQEIAVAIQGDLIDEPNENFTLELSDAFEGTAPVALTDSSATGTIVDDDDAPVVSVADTSAVELDSGDPDVDLTFVISLSNPSWQALTLDYFTAQVINADGTLAFDAAVAGTDYESTYDLTPASITIPALATSAILPIKVKGDDLDEYDERFSLMIQLNAATSSAAATLDDAVALGTILDDNTATPAEDDDDPMPLVFVDDGDAVLIRAEEIVSEGHAGNTTVHFTIELEAVSGRPVTVDWNTAAGTAVASPIELADFNDAFESVVFAPGEISREIAIEIVGDTRDEGPNLPESGEKLFANLLRARNGQLGTTQDALNHAVIVIQDDDDGADAGPWHVQFSSAAYSVNESDDYATITLARAGGSSEPIALYWSMGGGGIGRGTSGLDYAGIREAGGTGERGMVRFEEGETLKTFTIDILPDFVFEGDETVDLYLANPTGGPVRGVINHAVLTIVEDDALPQISINDVTVVEPTAGLRFAVFTVTATGSTDVPILVNWAAANGPALEPITTTAFIGGEVRVIAISGTPISFDGSSAALANDDYQPAAGSFTIPAFSGVSVDTSVRVGVRADALVENLEEFVVHLSLPSDEVAELSDYQGVGTIDDVDTATLTGRVFFDADGDGSFDLGEDYGLANLDVQLSEGSTVHQTAVTDADGNYAFGQPVSEYTVTVLDTDPDFPIDASVTTAANPLTVSFTNTSLVAPDIGLTTVAAGIAPTSSIGNGSSFSSDTAYGGLGNDVVSGGGGDDWLVGGHWLGPGCACDGDAYDASLREELGGDSLRTRVYVDPASITANRTLQGRVWLESGTDDQDLSGEAGIANIQVNLFDETWTLIGTTYSAANGEYAFERLTPCKYTVQFLPSAGYAFVAANQGAGPNQDRSDSDAATDTGLTAQVDLTVSGPSDASANVDAGLRQLPPGSAGPWSLQFSHLVYSVRETDGFGTILVRRTVDSFEAVGVYFTADGTALAGTDYDAARGTSRFGDDEQEKAFVVPIIVDTVEEGFETVRLALQNPTGGPVTGNLPAALLLIFDNPCPDDDQVTGGDGNDVLLGDFGYFNGGAPVLLGGMGNDSLLGEGGNDNLYGEGGNDLLDGGTGDDTQVGGGENDSYRFDADVAQGTDTITEVSSPFGGNDTIDLSSTTSRSVSLDLGVSGIQNVSTQTVGSTTTVLLALSVPVDVIENVTGGSLGDSLVGNLLDNILIGGSGADVLEGKGGNDELDGGAGGDVFRFNAGAPLGHDNVYEPALADTDLIDFAGTPIGVQLDLGVNTSQTVNGNLTLTILTAAPGVTVTRFGDGLVLFESRTGLVVNSAASSSIENLYGGLGGDVLTGNSRDNVIWGREGNDQLDGGSGGYDVLKEERAGNWNLNVLDAATGQLTLGAELNTFTLGTFDEVTLTGDDTANVLDATSFNGVVRLDGLGGDDVIRGGAGINYLSGGAGADHIVAGSGTNTLSEERDADFVLTDEQLQIDPVDGAVETDTITGSIQFVELTGGDSGNRIDASAFTGVATLDGGGGNDVLLGTRGPDTLIGGAGDDTLRGGFGDDSYAFDVDSLLYDDTLTSPVGDVVDDAGGVDTLDFSLSSDVGVTISLALHTLQTLNQNLLLTLFDTNGNAIADEVENIGGSQQDDVLIGNTLSNTIEGNEGNDTITGAGAADVLRGGDGSNAPGLAFVDRLLETVNAGTSTLSDASLAPDADVLVGFEAATLRGGPGTNIMDASAFSGSVILEGGAGSDTLIGGAANDSLVGGPGDDTLRGNAGDDTYQFNVDLPLGSDRIEEEIGSGFDTLDFSTTTAVGLTVDLAAGLGSTQVVHPNLSLTFADLDGDGQGDLLEGVIGGLLDDRITGNNLANTLEGGDGADTLSGGDGDDLLIGGEGNDTYSFAVTPASSLGSDTLLEDVGTGGVDTLDFTGSSLAITLDLGKGASQSAVASELTLTLIRCSSFENFIGGSGADHVAGNSLGNRFEGRGGDDQLSGGTGNDTYAFDADTALGLDTIGLDPLDRDGDGLNDDLATETSDIEGGIDTLDFTGTGAAAQVSLDSASVQTVNASLSLMLNFGRSLENLLGGSGDDTLTGNTLSNLIEGGAGTDTISGRDGDDILRGGAGNDLTLDGGRGSDVLDGGIGNDALAGGLGSDSYIFEAFWGQDAITENANAGIDSFDFSAISTALTVDVASATTVANATNTFFAAHPGTNIERIITGAGIDVCSIRPSPTTAFALVAAAGSDTLDYDAPTGGTTNVDGVISTVGFAPVTHSGFETINL